MKVFILSAILFSWMAAAGALGDKDKPPLEPKVVDSGSFGLFLGGKRIGTETFKIEQKSDFSIATAELKVDDGNVHAAQNAEMRVNPNGDLRSYIWRSTTPRTEEASVEVQNQVLVEHIVPENQKKVDVPHMLPLSTVILDDNFFSQREVLLWRYLATGCVWKEGTGRMCGTTTFPVLVPQQHLSANATLEAAGTEKVTVKGTQRELNKVILSFGDPKQLVVMNAGPAADTGQWVLWVDDQYKVVKITFTGSNFEVIRD